MDEQDPEDALVLTYVASERRAAFSALLALDRALADVVRTTSEPAIGQMRLAWWHGQLEALDRDGAPAMPVLQALSRHVVPIVSGTRLAAMVDGWDVPVEEAVLDDAALRRFARERGGRLFELIAAVLGRGEEPVGPAGEGWALADMARHLTDPAAAARAAALAQGAFSAAALPGRRLRPLGLMALRARLDLAGVAAGSVRRATRLAGYALFAR